MSTAINAAAHRDCKAVEDKGGVTVLFAVVYIICVVSTIAYVSRRRDSLTIMLGLSPAGWAFIQLGLLDILFDFYYFVTEPFANAALMRALFAFLFITQIAPCLVLCQVVRIHCLSSGFHCFEYPFGWTAEDLSDLFKMTAAVLYNIFFRPLRLMAWFVSCLLLFNMKLMALDDFVPILFYGMEEEAVKFCKANLACLFDDAAEEETKRVVNLKMIFFMFFNRILLQDFPQLLIQILNNSALGEWSVVAVLSAATSIFMMIRSVFEPCYRICVLKQERTKAFEHIVAQAKSQVVITYQEEIADLQNQIGAAVAVEDFDLAQSLKLQIQEKEAAKESAQNEAKQRQELLVSLDNKIIELKDKKEAAIANEDYAEAGRVKAELEEAQQQRAGMV